MSKQRTAATIVSLTVAAASLIGLGAIAAPLASSQVPAAIPMPAPSGTTLIVHLVDPSGLPLASVDESAVVELTADRGERQPLELYASSKPQGCYQGRCSSGHVSPVHGGIATFPNHSSKYTYVADVDLGNAFVSSPYGEIRIAKGKTRVIALRVTRLASIAGRVTAPDGSAVGGISIAAIDASGGVASKATSRPDGSYRITGLSTGSYSIRFGGSPYAQVSHVAQYGWAFWNDRSPVAVHSQTATRAASSVRGIDGRPAVGHTLRVIERLAPDGRDRTDSSGTGRFTGPNSVDLLGGPANSQLAIGFGPDYTATARIPAGDYYLRTFVFNSNGDGDVPFYYAGDGMPEVRSLKNAVAVHFYGTADQTVTFGASSKP